MLAASSCGTLSIVIERAPMRFAGSGVAEYRHSVELLQSDHGAFDERPLVLTHGLHARLLEKAEGRGERYGAGGCSGAALVPFGDFL